MGKPYRVRTRYTTVQAATCHITCSIVVGKCVVQDAQWSPPYRNPNEQKLNVVLLPETIPMEPVGTGDVHIRSLLEKEVIVIT
jgi:hypothetical protein